jgi:hypothetical protein
MFHEGDKVEALRDGRFAGFHSFNFAKSNNFSYEKGTVASVQGQRVRIDFDSEHRDEVDIQNVRRLVR